MMRRSAEGLRPSLSAWAPRHAQSTSRKRTFAWECTHAQPLHTVVLSHAMQEGVNAAALEATAGALVQAVLNRAGAGAAGFGQLQHIGTVMNNGMA